ncbi:MAG: DUF4258 domain-containing protein [Patescibacteria group bacterium]
MQFAMVKIIFSPHAKLQLVERKISEREVIETINKPTKVIQQLNRRFQAIKIKVRNEKKYLLVVIYDEALLTKEVVTAFYTSKIKKYL